MFPENARGCQSIACMAWTHMPHSLGHMVRWSTSTALPDNKEFFLGGGIATKAQQVHQAVLPDGSGLREKIACVVVSRRWGKRSFGRVGQLPLGTQVLLLPRGVHSPVGVGSLHSQSSPAREVLRVLSSTSDVGIVTHTHIRIHAQKREQMELKPRSERWPVGQTRP